jgi:hypothetical protein
LGTIFPQHARHLQVRFGVNLIFGAQKSKNLNAAYNRISMSEYKSKKAADKSLKKSSKELDESI